MNPGPDDLRALRAQFINPETYRAELREGISIAADEYRRHETTPHLRPYFLEAARLLERVRDRIDQIGTDLKNLDECKARAVAVTKYLHARVAGPMGMPDAPDPDETLETFRSAYPDIFGECK